MKNQRQNLQRQIADLIPLLEICLPLIKQIDRTQGKLKLLPVELEQLKEYAELLNLKPSLEKPQNSDSAESSLRSPIEATHYKLDSIVDDLEGILVYLTNLDCQLKNVLALKERLEAVQEERIDGITPDRIYKLLEKQQQLKSQDKYANSPTKTIRLRRVWQKLLNYKYSKKIAITTAITTVIIISFSVIFNTSSEKRSIESDITGQNKQINKIIN